MTFAFEKERIRAISDDGRPMGHIAFPRVRAGLVNISQVVTAPEYHNQNVEHAMMEALFTHLEKLGLKAALTCPLAQQYLEQHSEWKTILPGEIHFARY